MIILPTEKSFDWQHTPVVLISLVILNIFIFFFYQGGDGKKWERAYFQYEEAQLLSVEWPLYRDYLSEQGNAEYLVQLQASMDNGMASEVSQSLLQDIGFNLYLNEKYHELMPDHVYIQWSSARRVVDSALGSISFIRFGLIPSQINAIDIFTHQFLHGDAMHLFGNLFFLLVCGFAVEAAVGHLRFLVFYLITGVVAGLSHALMDLTSQASLVGASGAISGVMAMYLGVFRLRKIQFFYWFFIFVGYFRAPALLILPIYIGKEVFDYINSDGSNIAYLAHAGGFVTGGLLITVSLLINPQTMDEEYLDTDQASNEYQEKLDKVFKAIENYQFTSALKHLVTMIQEYGLNFHLAMLRYNLGKIHKPQEFTHWVNDVFMLKTRCLNELEKINNVWKDNQAIAKKLDDKHAFELGLRFANTRQFTSAEFIFKSLLDKSAQHLQLTTLALKLAEAAKQLQQTEKRKEYLQFSRARGGMHK